MRTRWKSTNTIGAMKTNDRTRSVPKKLLMITHPELSANTGETNTIHVAGSEMTSEIA